MTQQATPVPPAFQRLPGIALGRQDVIQQSDAEPVGFVFPAASTAAAQEQTAQERSFGVRRGLEGRTQDFVEPAGQCAHALGQTKGFMGRVFVYRSEEHTSELQSLMRISYAVFCLKKKKIKEKLVT